MKGIALVLFPIVSTLYNVAQVGSQGRLVISVEEAQVEVQNLAAKEEHPGGLSITVKPKFCSTASDCVTEHCCSGQISCCLHTGQCGCQKPDSKTCGSGPIAVVANNGKIENTELGIMDQVGTVACVRKGKLKEKTIAVSFNVLHPSLIFNGEIQQQMDDYVFHSKFYGRFSSEELVKSVISRLRGKDIVDYLDEEQMEETVFEAIRRSAEPLLSQFSGKEILDLLSDLQLEELFDEARRKRRADI